MSNTSKQTELSPALNFIAEYDGTIATIPTSKIMTLSITAMPTQANASNNIDEFTKEKTSWFQILCNFKSAYAGTNSNGELVDGNATLNTLKIKIQNAHMVKYGVTTDELIAFFNKHYVDVRFVTLPLSSYTPVLESKSCGFEMIEGKNKTKWIKTPVKNHFEAVVSEYFDLKNFIVETDKMFSKLDKK